VQNTTLKHQSINKNGVAFCTNYCTFLHSAEQQNRMQENLTTEMLLNQGVMDVSSPMRQFFFILAAQPILFHFGCATEYLWAQASALSKMVTPGQANSTDDHCFERGCVFSQSHCRAEPSSNGDTCNMSDQIEKSATTNDGLPESCGKQVPAKLCTSSLPPPLPPKKQKKRKG